MSFRSMILACAAVGLVAAAPLAAQAPQACDTNSQEKARTGKRLGAALKLTDEQRSQMETIRAKHAVELTAKRQALREAEKAFQKAVLDPSSTPDQLKKLHKPVAERQFDLMLAQRALRLEQRAVLTPAQQAEADKFFKDKGPVKPRGSRRSKGMDR